MIFQEVPLNVVLTIYSEDIDEDYIYGKIVGEKYLKKV